jgi:hypothetical protein
MDNHLKTLINEGTELRVPIWHSGTREAFLIHVGSAREAIKKMGYFKSFEEYSGTFTERCKKIKELRDQLTELKEASETSVETLGQTGTSRKSNKNSKETTVEANEESSTTLRTANKADLKQALEATEEVMTKRDTAAEDTFQLYADLLSIDARYAWNKIVQEQTNSDPYTELQGLTRKGPRGMLCKSFKDCVMFHLLTMFPNNAAEQER